MTADRRILLTGGGGFIGGHLAHALLAEGWAVDVADDLSTGSAANVPAGAELLELDATGPLRSGVLGDERMRGERGAARERGEQAAQPA